MLTLPVFFLPALTNILSGGLRKKLCVNIVAIVAIVTKKGNKEWPSPTAAEIAC